MFEGAVAGRLAVGHGSHSRRRGRPRSHDQLAARRHRRAGPSRRRSRHDLRARRRAAPWGRTVPRISCTGGKGGEREARGDSHRDQRGGFNAPRSSRPSRPAIRDAARVRQTRFADRGGLRPLGRGARRRACRADRQDDATRGQAAPFPRGGSSWSRPPTFTDAISAPPQPRPSREGRHPLSDPSHIPLHQPPPRAPLPAPPTRLSRTERDGANARGSQPEGVETRMGLDEPWRAAREVRRAEPYPSSRGRAPNHRPASASWTAHR